jgi:hypothetical protein
MPEATLTRRAVLHGTAGAAAGLAAAVAAPHGAFAHDHGHHHAPPVPPEPIPGGIELAPGQVIHVWAPGPTDVTLPSTGSTLQGLDVESTTIRDFKHQVPGGGHEVADRVGVDESVKPRGS